MRRISTIKYVGAALAMVAMPLAAFAADVTSDAEVTLELPSDGSTYSLKSGASFDQMDVSAGTLTFTANAASAVSIDLRSGGKKTLTNSRNASIECLESESKVVISTGPGDTTITPSGTCGGGGGGGTSGGGGGGTASGGGGGGGFATAPTVKTVDKVGQLRQQIADVQAQITQKIGASGSVTAQLVSKNLALGDRNDEVNTLQQLLAQDTGVYPEGIVSGFFGPATQRAVKRFQAKYGITQLGNVGPQTRAKLQELFGVGAASVAALPPASSYAEPASVSAVSAGIPSRILSPGTRDDEVRMLQQLLASDPAIYPEATVSGYYGPATTRAVRAFQLKYGVIQEAADTGNGRVGPKTLAKLQEVFSGGAPTVSVSASATGETAAPVPAVPAASAAQLKAVQEQIQALQAKLLQEQIKAIQEKINALKK